eukprot:scaffold2531_cov125-Isochrysis_galbana.AAC.5
MFLATARAIEARIERLAGETPHLRAFCESALSTRDRLVRQLNKLTDELNAQVRLIHLGMVRFYTSMRDALSAHGRARFAFVWAYPCSISVIPLLYLSHTHSLFRFELCSSSAVTPTPSLACGPSCSPAHSRLSRPHTPLHQGPTSPTHSQPLPRPALLPPPPNPPHLLLRSGNPPPRSPHSPHTSPPPLYQIRQHHTAMLAVAEDDHEEQSRLDSYRVHEGDVGEAARRNEYLRLRSSRHEAERNAVRYGALRSQLESWVAEFQKVVRGSSREVRCARANTPPPATSFSCVSEFRRARHTHNQSNTHPNRLLLHARSHPPRRLLLLHARSHLPRPSPV